MIRTLLIAFALFYFVGASHGQLPSVTTLMKGETFIGAWPKDAMFSALGDSIFFKRENEYDTLARLYAYADGDVHKLTTSHKRRFGQRVEHPSLPIFLWVKDRAIYRGNYERDSLKLLFELPKKVKDIHWLGKNEDFAFTIDKHIMIYTKSGALKTLAHWAGRSEEHKNDAEKWLDEQQNMFSVLQHRKKQEQARKQRDKKEKSIFKITAPDKKGRWSNFTVSADRKFIWATLKKRKAKTTDFMDYITKSGDSESKKARSKVGQYSVDQSLWLYKSDEDEVDKIDFSNLPEMHKKPAFLNSKKKRKHPKSFVVHGPEFSPHSNWGLVSLKSTDNKDRWICLVHPTKGIRLVDHQHDSAWIGGPGIAGWNSVQGNMGWMDRGKKVWFQSEKTGYSHLYSYDLTKKKMKQLSQGSFEIRSAKLSKDKDKFYITANKTSPGVRNFYHFNWRQKSWIPILTGKAAYQVEIAPDEKTLAGRYSTLIDPWTLFTAKNTENAKAEMQTNTTTEQFDSIDWKEPDLIHFTARDGVKVPARLYKPDNPNGAAVIFVHGAGYLQNAHYWWSVYFREYMFNQKLRSEGYTVLDIDYRASDGYGRDWRTAIYRHMGGKDLEDQIDGRQYLIDSLSIDPDRVGIYGGSYGGFITLMALLKEPGKFQCGAAIRSVTDWAHYNHPYTANILNTPVQDSMAYVKSSPIYYADGLEDRLLMLHGVLDNNVQYQDILRLSQRFIELSKENWNLMSYPLEPHGFKHPTSWQDEYRRIHKMFQEELGQ